MLRAAGRPRQGTEQGTPSQGKGDREGKEQGTPRQGKDGEEFKEQGTPRQSKDDKKGTEQGTPRQGKGDKKVTEQGTPSQGKDDEEDQEGLEREGQGPRRAMRINEATHVGRPFSTSRTSCRGPRVLAWDSPRAAPAIRQPHAAFVFAV